MANGKDCIGRAHSIAVALEAEGFSHVEVGIILAMALGIFVEGQEGSHRGMAPLFKAHLDVAQQTFDALRIGRAHEPGNA